MVASSVAGKMVWVRDGAMLGKYCQSRGECQDEGMKGAKNQEL
jgi:hypothetical protein